MMAQEGMTQTKRRSTTTTTTVERGRKRDLKSEDNVELCFIHITFIPCLARLSRYEDTVNDLDAFNDHKARNYFRTMHG
jgi:hypothetical protein